MPNLPAYNCRDEISKWALQIENIPLDIKLEDPNINLESLLDDEGIISEFRGCNSRLLNR